MNIGPASRQHGGAHNAVNAEGSSWDNYVPCDTMRLQAECRYGCAGKVR